MGARDGRGSYKKKIGRYDRCDRYGGYGGYDALKNPHGMVLTTATEFQKRHDQAAARGDYQSACFPASDDHVQHDHLPKTSVGRDVSNRNEITQHTRSRPSEKVLL